MKVLITRPHSQADRFADGLKAAGFEPVFFPVIEIRPTDDNTALERAIARLDCYDWVVFTSVNGVDAFFAHLEERAVMPENLKVAAIGPKTAQALELHSVEPDFIPDEYVAEAILPGLGDLRGRWILLPRAEMARKALPEAIHAAGGVAHEIAVYRTLPAKPDPDGLAALKSGVEVVTLTSPSTAHNFVEIVHDAGLDARNLPGQPRFACIGPITQKAAEEEGLRNLLVSDEFTTEGLTRAILGLKVK